MPVNILDIPAEKKHASKTPSFLFWGLGGICAIIIYAAVFLGFFHQYLSLHSSVFWLQLILIPALLWSAVFLFWTVLSDRPVLEAKYWNESRAEHYNDLLKQGQSHFDIVTLKVLCPDIDGHVTDSVSSAVLPVRPVPALTHTARYLAFSTPTEISVLAENRVQYLFDDLMNRLAEEIRVNLDLLPKTTSLHVVCLLDPVLHASMRDVWSTHFNDVLAVSSLVFSTQFAEPVDVWLDTPEGEYIMFISANIKSTEMLADIKDGYSEMAFFMLGKRCEENQTSSSPITLYRPESGWQGIEKSVLWGDIKEDNKLAGILFSGLDENEKSALVSDTLKIMVNDALKNGDYQETTHLFGNSPPVTVMLQIKYIESYLKAGLYLIINKSGDKLITHLLKSGRGN